MQDENKRGCWVGGKGRVLIQDAERPLKFGINFYRSVLQFFFFFFLQWEVMPGDLPSGKQVVMGVQVFCPDTYSPSILPFSSDSLRKTLVLLLFSILQGSFLPLPVVQGKLISVVERKCCHPLSFFYFYF